MGQAGSAGICTLFAQAGDNCRRNAKCPRQGGHFGVITALLQNYAWARTEPARDFASCEYSLPCITLEAICLSSGLVSRPRAAWERTEPARDFSVEPGPYRLAQHQDCTQQHLIFERKNEMALWLSEKCPPQAPIFKHSVPSCWCCMRIHGTFRRRGLSGGHMSLRMGFESL